MERSQKEIASFRRLKNACFNDLEEARHMVVAEPALLEARSYAGETAMLWLAIENEFTAVTALLDWGAELDTVNDSDATPLLHCVTLGYSELIALLVARGARVSHKSNTGQSPVSGLRSCAKKSP